MTHDRQPTLDELPVSTPPEQEHMRAAGWRPISRAKQLHLMARLGPVPEVENATAEGW